MLSFIKDITIFGRPPLAVRILLIVFLSSSVFAQPSRVLINPYDGIDWGTINQYKANLHTHSLESDGALPPVEAIDLYANRNYSILALTDHRKITYPWQDWGRDPAALGMLDIPGCEYSNHNHMNGYFLHYTTNPPSLEASLTEIASQGGVAHLNHPGNYWNLVNGEIPVETMQKYVKWFSDFPTNVLMGMEVVNKIHLHPQDERLWDALLGVMMPDRPIWGFSNDDMHGPWLGPVRLVEVSWNIFLANSLDETSVREAMINGSSYFSTCGTRRDPAVWDVNKVPVITNILHDEVSGTISISALSGGLPLPESDYRWISGSEVIHVGPVLDYQNTPGIFNYVRAQLEGPGGTTFTNPFGILSDNGWLTVYIGPADAIYSGAKWQIGGDETWHVHGDTIELAPGTYTISFSRISMYRTPDPITLTITKDKTTLITSAEGAEYLYDLSMRLPASGPAMVLTLMVFLLTTGIFFLARFKSSLSVR
jgi:hypothetical protein